MHQPITALDRTDPEWVEAEGPQKGRRRRTSPVHTMLDTGLDAKRGTQGFPHGLGGAADGTYEFGLTAAPLPVAVGAPVAPIGVK